MSCGCDTSRFNPDIGSDKVKIDSSDTTAGFLASKLSAGTNITLTVVNPGGNERIRIDAAAPTLDHKVAASGTDTTPNFLLPKLAVGIGLGLALLNGGGNEQVQITLSSLGGQLSGTLPNPNVIGLTETGGPTQLTIGAIADGQVLQRSGTTLIGATPITGPANPGDNGKIPRASGGNFVYIGGSVNDVLTFNGTQWAGASLVNANVNAAAAIAGTKISPDFGSQLVTTTGGVASNNTAGFLRVGPVAGSGTGSASSVGALRVGATTGVAQSTAGLFSRVGADTGDIGVIGYQAPTNVIWINDNGTFSPAGVRATSVSLAIGAGGTFTIANSTGSSLVVMNPTGTITSLLNWAFDATKVSPSVIQNTNSNASSIGQILLIHAQDCTGTTSTGGELQVRPGSGTTAGGELSLQTGGTTKRLRINDTGLGLYATAPVAQATRVGQLTDNTTGTPSATIPDVGGAFSQTTLNNIHASLLTKINGIESRLSAAGGGIGLTA